MRIYTSVALWLLILSYSLPFSAQELRNPFDFPILLSGNFGELRNNHFHAGIDFKTQGVEGKPIYAVADGYVSRISVSPYGYGHALYLDHPDSTTTVYGHLLKYNSVIAAYVKEKQYEQENFTINLYPENEQFPVKRGELIAYAGNTGGSAGPHLHFEVRDTYTEEVLDPLPYFKNKIKDTRPPRVQGVMFYPFEGRGVINNNSRKVELKPANANNNPVTLTGRIEAWGEIGIAIKAYDYMDNTNNIYGVKSITLELDGLEVFDSYIDRFAFDETRYLNSFVDYADWKDNRSFYMKSFVDPGNKLRFIKSRNRGIISINEEREYKLTYRLTDEYGNQTVLHFTVQGKEQPIAAPETTGRYYFHWKSDNKFGAKGIRFSIPRYNLYDDIYFKYSVKEDSAALAATHILHDKTIPLHQSAQLSIRIQHDTISNKKQLGIVRIDKGRASWIGGEYRNGWIDANIRDFGTYTIRQDTKGPVITPVNKEKWGSSSQINIRVSDNLSGFKTYRGEIDGEFVLFELDGKRGMLTYSLKERPWARGRHVVRLVAEDACGNTSVYEEMFVY